MPETHFNRGKGKEVGELGNIFELNIKICVGVRCKTPRICVEKGILRIKMCGLANRQGGFVEKRK